MTIMHRTLGLILNGYKLIPAKASCRRKCLHPWKNLIWYLTSLGERKAKTIGIGEFALKSGIIRHCAETFIFSTAIPSRRKGWQPFLTFAKGSPLIRGKVVVLCPFFPHWIYTYTLGKFKKRTPTKRKPCNSLELQGLTGSPGETRTRYLLLRRQLLYPDELPDQYTYL